LFEEVMFYCYHPSEIEALDTSLLAYYTADIGILKDMISPQSGKEERKAGGDDEISDSRDGWSDG
jgi:hypothetical protein